MYRPVWPIVYYVTLRVISLMLIIVIIMRVFDFYGVIMLSDKDRELYMLPLYVYVIINLILGIKDPKDLGKIIIIIIIIILIPHSV